MQIKPLPPPLTNLIPGIGLALGGAVMAFYLLAVTVSVVTNDLSDFQSLVEALLIYGVIFVLPATSTFPREPTSVASPSPTFKLTYYPWAIPPQFKKGSALAQRYEGENECGNARPQHEHSAGALIPRREAWGGASPLLRKHPSCGFPSLGRVRSASHCDGERLGHRDRSHAPTGVTMVSTWVGHGERIIRSGRVRCVPLRRGERLTYRRSI